MIYTKGALEMYISKSMSEIIHTANGLTPFEDSKIDFNSVCVVCGKKMKKASDEHVLPKWLMKEFDIYNVKMTLPNHTPFPFRKCTIPCCKTCNNEEMGDLEKTVKRVLNKDINKINATDEYHLFLWFAKLCLGMGIKLTTLKNDRKNPNSKKILPVEYVNPYSEILGIIKLLKYPAEFINFKPFSLFKFDIPESKEKPVNFLIAIRRPVILFIYKNKGFVMALGERGIIEEEEAKKKRTSTPPHDSPIGLLIKFCSVITQYDLVQPVHNYSAIVDGSRTVFFARSEDPDFEGQPHMLPFDISLFKRNLIEYSRMWGIQLDKDYLNNMVKNYYK